MSLTVENNSGNSFLCEKFNETKHTINLFSNEIILKIFSHLNLTTVITISSVNLEWEQLARDPILLKTVIYRQTAFTNEQWARCFGENVVKDENSREEFSSLPWQEFIEDCKKFKGIFTEENALDNLMLVRLPTTLNGGLTLESLGELAKQYFSDGINYRGIFPPSVDLLKKKTFSKQSYWVTMTKKILPESRNKTYTEQQKKLDQTGLIDYKMPNILEASACIFAQYFDSNQFNNTEKTFTYCIATTQSMNLCVGDLTDATGLKVRNFGKYTYEYVGVVALRRFFDKSVESEK